MLKILIRKEILNNLLNLRFSLTYFLCAFLLIGSAAIMLADYSAQKRIYDMNNNKFNATLTGAREFWQFLWWEKVVCRKPPITKIFATGGQRDPDLTAKFTAEFPPAFFGDFKRNPLVNLFPSVDMVFIVGVILSLLIFVLTYDTISGEREEGTLKLLLSGPAPRDLVILAKWLGGFFSLVIPLATSWLTVVIMLLLTSGFSVTADDWIRITLVFAACTLYVGVVFSLSMMISAVAKNSSSSIMTLLLVWVVGIVLIPSLATPIAYVVVNPPGVQQTDIETRRIGIVDYMNQGAKMNAYIKKTYGVDSVNQLPQDKMQTISSEHEKRYLHEKIDSMVIVNKQLTRSEERIDDLTRWMVRISPYGLLQNMATTLANTGFGHEKELRNSIESYAGKMGEYLDQPQFWYDKPFDNSNAPRYSMRVASIGQNLADVLIDAVLLCVMGLLFFMVAYVRFLRMETL